MAFTSIMLRCRMPGPRAGVATRARLPDQPDIHHAVHPQIHDTSSVSLSQQIQAVDSSKQADASGSGGVGLWCIPMVAVAVAVMRKLIKASRGSVTSLEYRGHISADRLETEREPWREEVDKVGEALRSVNYTDYSNLTEDEIAKHRHRRELERDDSGIDLKDIDVPDNHPWATNKQDDGPTDEVIEERLSAQRGMARRVRASSQHEHSVRLSSKEMQDEIMKEAMDLQDNGWRR